MPLYQVDVDGQTVEFDSPVDLTPEQLEAEVSGFRSQIAPPAAPEEAPGYISQLGTSLYQSGRQALGGARTAFNALTGDTADMAAGLQQQAEAQRALQEAQTPEDVAFLEDLNKQAEELKQARGFLPTLSEAIDLPMAALRQPGAAIKTAVQSLPNALISTPITLGAGLVGTAAGGLVGLPTTGPGAVATGIAGGIAAGTAANTALEAGSEIYQRFVERIGDPAGMTREQIAAALDQNPDIASEGLTTGLTRGAVIGTIETLGLKGAGALLAAPERAAIQATRQVLTRSGVDLADDAAVRAAMATPEMAKATKAAADAARAGFNVPARAAGAGAVEIGASGVGEALAQQAVGQETDYADVFLEMLGEGVAAAPSVLAARGVELAGTGIQAVRERVSEQVADNAKADARLDIDDLINNAGENAAIQVNQAVDDAAKVVPAGQPTVEGEMPIEVMPPVTSPTPETQKTSQGTGVIYSPLPAPRPTSALASAGLESDVDLGPIPPEGRTFTSADFGTRGLVMGGASESQLEAMLLSAIKSGREVTLIKEGKPRRMGIRDGNRLVDSDGNRWFPLGALSGGGEFVVGPATAPAPQPVSEPTPITPQSLPTGQAQAPAPGAATQTQPTLPNAPETRQIPEGGQLQRQDVDEGGPTAEAGGGNRPVQGGQVQAQEVTVAPVQPLPAAPALGELPAPQAEVVSPEGVTPPQPLPPTGGVPTESLPAGQPTSGDVGTALRAVATNTATPEQVASLEAQGLARTVQGQPVITDAGLAQMPEAERPRLTEAERVAEIEGQGGVMASLRDMDVEYMDAVARGDMETAQRLVDEAARAAGYSIGPVEHGSDQDFVTFEKRGRSSTRSVASGETFHFTTEPGMARTYGKNVRKFYLKGNFVGFSVGAVQAFYDPRTFRFLLESEVFSDQTATPDQVVASVTTVTPATKSWLVERGYDGVMSRWDGGTEYAVFNPSQIKSADPVTYDDNGNVIPLSQRFQPESPDIRFSVRNTPPANVQPSTRPLQGDQQRNETSARRRRGKAQVPASLRDRDGPPLPNIKVNANDGARAREIEDKQVPGAKDTWIGTAAEYLAEFPDQTAVNDRRVEAFYDAATDRAVILIDRVVARDGDAIRAARNGTSAAVEAVRRLIRHESFVHRGWRALPQNLKTEFLGIAESLVPEEEIEAIVAKGYSRYAGWRTDPAVRALVVEEWLAQRLETLEKLPATDGGPLSRLIDWAKRVWQWLNGNDAVEPTRAELVDVMRQMIRALEIGEKESAADAGIRPSMTSGYFIGGMLPIDLRLPIFTTQSREGAEWYAENRGEGGRVSNVSVSAKNPFMLENQRDLAALSGILNGLGIEHTFTEGETWNVPLVSEYSPYEGDNPFDVAYIPQVREALVSRGYDSLRGPDILENTAIDTTVLIESPSQVSFDGREQSVMASLTDTDAAYMDAVARGDMETAQRLVDQMARRSGKLFGKWFHGSPSGVRFEVFDPTKGRSFGRWNAIGSWFTLDRKAAAGWAENYQRSAEGRLVPNAGTVYDSYLFINNPLSLDGYDALLDLWTETTGVDTAKATLSDVEKFKSAVRERGYDGLVVSNVEGDSPQNADPSQTYAIAFDPNQIKSADPVTYDDNGNVIPLSQRFQPESPDIRFSLTDPTASNIIQDANQTTNEQQPTRSRPLSPETAPGRATEVLPTGEEIVERTQIDKTSMPRLEALAIKFVDSLGPVDTWPNKILNTAWWRANGGNMRDEFGRMVMTEALYRTGIGALQGNPTLVEVNDLISREYQIGATSAAKALATQSYVTTSERYGPMFAVQGMVDQRRRQQETVIDANVDVAAGVDAVNNADAQAQSDASAELDEELRLKDAIYELGLAARTPEIQTRIRRINDNVFRLGVLAQIREQLLSRVQASFVGLSRAAVEQQYASLSVEQIDAEIARLEREVADDVAAVESERQRVRAAPKPKGAAADPITQARTIIARLEADPKTKKTPKANPVRDLYREHLKNPMAEDEFMTRMAGIGVPAAEAQKLYDLAAVKIAATEAVKAQREAEDEAKKLSDAERFAERVINDAAERFADPPIEENGRKDLPNKRKSLSIRDLFNFHVQNGMTLEAFIPAAAQVGLDEATARRLHGAGLLVRDARQSIKTARTEARLDDMAASEAGRLIYETSKLHRQSGYINTPSQAADTIRNVFMEQVKSPVSFEQFAQRLKGLRVDEDLAIRLFNVASRETAARQAMVEERKRQTSIRREIKLGDMAAKEAGRLIYETSKLHRQSGYINTTSPAADTIRKAFMDQVKDPKPFEQFVERLKALRVEEDLATRLFNVADREHTARKAVAYGRRLIERRERLLDAEGSALENLINKLRGKITGDLSWREMFDRPLETQRQWRRDLFAALRNDPALAGLTPQEIGDLVVEIDKVWEAKRKKNFEAQLKRMNLPGAKGNSKDKIVKSAPKLLRYINAGFFNDAAFRNAISEEFGIPALNEETVKQVVDLMQRAQADGITEVERKGLMLEAIRLMQRDLKAELGDILSNYWVTSVLSGFATQFDMAFSALNGMRVMAQSMADLAIRKLEFKLAGRAGMAYLRALGNVILEAARYFYTGDPKLLDNYQYTLNTYLTEGSAAANPFDYFERIIKDPNRPSWKKIMPYFYAGMQRAMTAFDHINSTATTQGMLEMAMFYNRELYEGARMPSKEDVAAARAKAVEMAGGDKTWGQKREVSSYTRQILNELLNKKYPGLLDEARDIGKVVSYTNDPTGIGGIVYHTLLGVTNKYINEAGEYRDKVRAQQEAASRTKRFMANLNYLTAANARNMTGLRFVRFVGNRLNEILSFTPGLGLLRLQEKGMTPTMRAMIIQNQTLGFSLSVLAGVTILRALTDEEDDEKRGFRISGSWSSLPPDKKNQLRASGRSPYAIELWNGKRWIGFNYNAWPIASIIATVGNLNDQRLFNPEKWEEKDFEDKLLSAAWAGAFSFKDLSALSGFMDMIGKSAYSTDPVEGATQWLAKFSTNYIGGFVPRMLKDIDLIMDPETRKARDFGAYFAKELPFFRRTEAAGEKLYNIFGEPVKLNRMPWRRAVTATREEPEYETLAELNRRGIFLGAANPSNRTVGSGATRRELTDAEAEKYMVETGKLYRDFIKQQGQSLLQLDRAQAEEVISKTTERLRAAALRMSIGATK